MKKQNCILKCIKNNICIDFERFSCKKPESIINQYKKAFKPYQFDDFYFKSYHEADKIEIAATPDGCNESEILAEYTPQEFFAAIS